MERTRNATRNIFFGTALKAYQMIIPFLMRTVMIYFMGVQYVGLNSLFTSILQVLNLAELGVGSAMVFSMYKPIAEGNVDEICALMQLYKAYYRIIGCIIAVVGLLVTPLIPYLVSGEIPRELNIYALYLLNLTATVFSYWLFAYKNSLLVAHQRTDVSSKVSIVIMTVQFCVQLLMLCVFKSYYLYLITTILCQIVSNIATSGIVSRMYPNYSAHGSLPKDKINTISGRIKDLFIAKIGGVVLSSVDTIVISAFLGLTVLATYQNYYFIVSSICGVMEMILTSITAGIGNSYITESKEKNYKDMKTISFLFYWITGMCSTCFIGIFQSFMNLWVGQELMLSVYVVVLLCIYFFIYETTRLLNVFKNAGGIWHEDRFRPLISAAVNLSLNLILVNCIGLYGIIISTIIALGVIEIPWLLKNIFSILYPQILFRNYLSLFVRWVCYTILSCLTVRFISVHIKLDDWNQFFFSIGVSLVVSNLLFLLFTIRTKEFRRGVVLVNRMTHGKI